MPVHLPPIGRRAFLRGVAAGAAGVLTLSHGRRLAAAQTGEHRLALLSDTHIPEAREIARGPVKMAENLQRVVQELVSLERKPEAALINGDCAFLRGLEADYRLLGELVKPLREHYPLHLTMGNHDDREQVRAVLAELTPADQPVASRHVTVIQMPGANWFLLDTLQKVNSTPGEVGEQQRQWLATALDAHPDTPAIIVMHHNPQRPTAERPKVTGLLDTAELLDLLAPRRQVKAVVFGHTHDWKVMQEEGIHLVNLPPVAYVFNAARPSGWVHAHVQGRAMELRLHALDATHPEHGQTVKLAFRA